MHRSCKTDKEILKPHHQVSLHTVKFAIEIAKGRKVVAVKPQSLSCSQGFPCDYHRGAMLIFEDRTCSPVCCDSVDIAAIMKYFTPRDIDDHFKSYVQGWDVKAELATHSDSGR